jgi:hypothetical protein
MIQVNITSVINSCTRQRVEVLVLLDNNAGVIPLAAAPVDGVTATMWM